MNDRIRELSEHAKEYASQNATGDWEVGPDYQDLFNKKFAELIVRECADISKHHVMNISTYADTEFVEERIKQHFGVEE